MHEEIARLLAATDTDDRRFPPTLLYSEGWLVRLVVDWYFQRPAFAGKLSPRPGATWYSEALLPSPFLRGPKPEGFTHADAVFGHFALNPHRGDIALTPSGRQLVVLEAKMNSPLSAGTTHAPSYNQAARNVACLAHLIEKAAVGEGDSDYRLLVVAPGEKIQEHEMAATVEPDALIAVIQTRADERGTADGEWARTFVAPLLKSGRLTAEALSWEAILDDMGRSGDPSVEGIRSFYRKCRAYNRVGVQDDT